MINTGNHSVTGTISILGHPVAMVVIGQTLYVTRSDDSKVSVIDITNDTVTSEITVGNNPYGLSANPAGTKIYVANMMGNSVSVINVANNSVDATISVGNRPTATEVTPDWQQGLCSKRFY